MTSEERLRECKKKGHDWNVDVADASYHEVMIILICKNCEAEAETSADVRSSDGRFIDWLL